MSDREQHIAVIGLSGRFPGAPDIATFWHNLRQGVEAVRPLSLEELRAEGVSDGLLEHPSYVRSAVVLDEVDRFDAEFFGYSAREAEVMDPQHRLFLECAWEAFEDAGYDIRRYDAPVGIFGSVMGSTYLLNNLASNPELMQAVGPLAVRIQNDKDFFATRASYKLHLRGPGLSVQTACSSSLVACHLACQSLLSWECDMALVGGASVGVPQKAGYLHVEGGIYSPDGHCRPFDASAGGTVSGNGVGTVVLKRLDRALEDGDRVRAVILGSAINNDGSAKVGFTAPSVEGQAEVVAAAQEFAGIGADSLGMIEAHGTGTALGDPIEVAALTQVFREQTSRRGFCAIGSVKSNLGHLDSAAGVASLIKTVLALEHGEIPPSLNCDEPNPRIDFPSTPFYVARQLEPWPENGGPRRAAVSSLGVGGTNAHVVLEQAPPTEPRTKSARPWQLLTLSARKGELLDRATERLATHLEQPVAPSQDAGEHLADVAYTLATGRADFAHRRFVVCRDTPEASARLRGEDGGLRDTTVGPDVGRDVVFLLPGQGSQYAGMGQGLYASESVYRRELDRCAEGLRPHLGSDLLELLHPAPGAREAADRRLAQTRLAQPAIFAVSYALTRLWQSWGVEPAALLGHSVGELVAACLAGVMSLDDALELIAFRGRLMQSLPRGSMLGVPLDPEALEPHLVAVSAGRVELAALNAPGQCTVAGPTAAVDELAATLVAEGVTCRSLHTSHAFHSAMMEPMLDAWAEKVASLRLSAPETPYLSNVTGTWIRAEEATDPAYWCEHVRRPVRFSQAVSTLLEGGERIFLEVGPGRVLTSLARRHRGPASGQGAPAVPSAVASLRHPRDEGEDQAILLAALGRLWQHGAEIDTECLWEGQQRRRLPLPTYPFERRRFWVERGSGALGKSRETTVLLPTGVSAELAETLRQELAEAGVAASVRSAVDLDDPLVRRALVEELAAAHGIGPQTERDELDVDEDDGDRWDTGWSELERGIAEVWLEQLGESELSLDSDFLELGGNSLLATQFLARLRERLGITLGLEEFLVAPTIGGVAEQLASKLALQGSDDDEIALEPVSRDEALPLSLAQQRLWVLDQLEPGNAAYNMPSAVRLLGEVDIEALRSALEELIERHESLRTAFVSRQGEPVQIIADIVPTPLEVVDLRDLEATEAQTAAERLTQSELARPFSLDRAPLLRLTLLQMADDDWRLLLVIHHIVSDGWSMNLLLRELVLLYAAQVEGRPDPLSSDPLPPLEIQVADHAVWQRRRLEGTGLAEQVASWRRELLGAPSRLMLPTDHPRPEVETPRGASRTLDLSPELVTAIRAVARRAEATPFMVYLAAWSVVMHALSGQKDLVIGTGITGRQRRELEGLIGFFVNTLALRVRCAGEPDFAELLGRVRDVTLRAYSMPEVPIEAIVESLALERDPSYSPLVQVVLTYISHPAPPRQVAGVEVLPQPFDIEVAKFDLELALVEREEQIRGIFVYRTDLFDAPTADAMLASWRSVLETVLADEHVSLADLVEGVRQNSTARRQKKQRTIKSLGQKSLGQIRRKAVLATPSET